MPTNNLSVPGIVGIAILVFLVLVIIVRNIYVVQQSRAYVAGCLPLRVGRGPASEGPLH